MADALLEALAYRSEHKQVKVRHEPANVHALVPGLVALFEDLVIGVFVLLDEALKTTVAACLWLALLAGEALVGKGVQAGRAD